MYGLLNSIQIHKSENLTSQEFQSLNLHIWRFF